MRKIIIAFGNNNYEIKDININLSFDDICDKFQQALDSNKVERLYMFDTKLNTYCCWEINEAGYLMGTNEYWKKVISNIVKQEFNIYLSLNEPNNIINKIKKKLKSEGILFGDIKKTEYGLKVYLDENSIKWKTIQYYDVVNTNSLLDLKSKIHKLFSDMEYYLHYSKAKKVWIEFYL